MKYVQEYLGHSNFSTTANIYTHVDVGDAMNQAMTTMTDIIGVSKEGNEKGSTNGQSQNGVEGIWTPAPDEPTYRISNPDPSTTWVQLLVLEQQD